MRIALAIFSVLVSIGLGPISCALVINILISFGKRPFVVYNPGPRGVQCFLLLIIISAYSVYLFLLNRNKKNYYLVMTALCSFLFSFIVTPVIITYSGDIHDFFVTPTHRTQMSIQNEIQKIIQENDLPYTLGSRESEKQTTDGVIVIILRKNNSDKIQQKEVELIINNSPRRKLFFVFYDQNQNESVSVARDKDEIFDCNPIEFCK
ncbi:hypothetical protein [Paenibacillus sp. NAIST15-1]|uniref:hypothetical protein n=1 Tax=Paenibacillus sp. NAIST15-1 TaxID=1605994 RepID=UPI00086B7465|nr:hypothetical protein [Paenibacillus sp. NAIST15-1]GAV10135.1 hypothetical protein PBN151_0038 [Paenibacillus sp. NAIST15-1]